MEALGRNPACIIPAWREFVAEHGGSGRPIRGVGEPIWPGRSDDELGECHQHESLLNLAFAETSDFWLLCPYDTTALETDVLEEARCTHPLVSHGNGSVESRTYVPPESSAGPFAGELQPPAAPPEEMAFDRIALRDVRTFVSEQATGAGMGPDRTADLVLAVCEVATNSVLHGGGKGRLSAWREPGRIVCEVRDAGRFEDPLAGRARPSNEIATGRGLWLVNHLCDLLQIRSSATGNVIRLHMSLN
jgi:anti-sigma regulatory factor (Ser/Thr protein kinase)